VKFECYAGNTDDIHSTKKTIKDRQFIGGMEPATDATVDIDKFCMVHGNIFSFLQNSRLF
jgi:hypothetical protein